LPEKEKHDYAEAVLERFRNPFIRHELLTIALNSVSKWKTRCLPTLLDYHRVTGTLPEHLTYSLAALIAFYRDGTHTRDDEAVLRFFRDRRDSPTLVADTLANTAFWGQDLTKIPGLFAAASVPVLFRLHPRDNVAVVTCTGHKVSLAPIANGSPVIKYGHPIGVATADIAAGEPVHTKNLRTALAGEERYSHTPADVKVTSIADTRTFDGYRRANGEVGIRNELWIIPTVGCVNETADAIAKKFGGDNVFVWKHPFGCSQLGEDHATTHRILTALARHPNAGGVLILGLGCENNSLASFRESLGGDERYRFLAAQETGDEIAEGVRLLRELAAVAAKTKREPVPLSALRVGLKCGGSDGFSGITANPLVGVFSDALVARGGTTLLTEVPEMFGAESLFLNRCVDRDVFDRAVAMLNGFKKYYLDHGQPVYENPSPGNKDGGITTLEEKSLGCTQKGGFAPVADVLEYGARLRRAGLNLLSAPGNDIVACTALAAAGAQLILFTTGRGTPLGSPVPVLKIATNSALASRKSHWIDFDAGRLLRGAAMDALAEELLARVVAVAGGERRTRSEENNFREVAIWKGGVTL
jgi:altronate dehydratase